MNRRAVVLIAVMLCTACHRQKTPVAPTVATTTSPSSASPSPGPSAAAPPPALPATPAPSAVALDNGNRAFARGDYGAASQEFVAYLNLVPSGGERDQALFRLGLIYALPGDRNDWQRAGNYLNQFVSEFPANPMKPAAQLILSLRADTAKLQSQAAVLASQADGRDQRIKQLNAEIEKRDQRIKQLNTEIERLIRIDSQKRGR